MACPDRKALVVRLVVSVGVAAGQVFPARARIQVFGGVCKSQLVCPDKKALVRP